MAKKAQKHAFAKRTRPARKRDLVRRPKASVYARRTARGRFKEMDVVGRSQKADNSRKAKKKVRSGYGDQGDERPRSPRRTRRFLDTPRTTDITRPHQESFVALSAALNSLHAQRGLGVRECPCTGIPLRVVSPRDREQIDPDSASSRNLYVIDASP